MRIALLTLTLLLPIIGSGQSYREAIWSWQRHYKEELVSDPRSPVKVADTGLLRFFEVRSRWRMNAVVVLTPNATGFDMATHSGKTKRFRPFAILKFHNEANRGFRWDSLVAYERLNPPPGDTLAALTLFVPFNDLTNGKETYGGGRYIDLLKADIKNGRIVLDFNKAYNPYCAFGDGFSCPIPPRENSLPVSVRAGERIWAKKAGL